MPQYERQGPRSSQAGTIVSRPRDAEQAQKTLGALEMLALTLTLSYRVKIVFLDISTNGQTLRFVRQEVRPNGCACGLACEQMSVDSEGHLMLRKKCN